MEPKQLIEHDWFRDNDRLQGNRLMDCNFTTQQSKDAISEAWDKVEFLSHFEIFFLLFNTKYVMPICDPH